MHFALPIKQFQFIMAPLLGFSRSRQDIWKVTVDLKVIAINFYSPFNRRCRNQIAAVFTRSRRQLNFCPEDN